MGSNSGFVPTAEQTSKDRAKAAEELKRRILLAKGREDTILGGSFGQPIQQKRLLGS